jgi:hypothetical protein
MSDGLGGNLGLQEATAAAAEEEEEGEEEEEEAWRSAAAFQGARWLVHTTTNAVHVLSLSSKLSLPHVLRHLLVKCLQRCAQKVSGISA